MFAWVVFWGKRIGGDGKIDFTLTSDSSIGIQVKTRYSASPNYIYYVAKQLAGSVLSQSASGCRKTSPPMTSLASHVLLNKHLARGGDK